MQKRHFIRATAIVDAIRRALQHAVGGALVPAVTFTHTDNV